MKSKWKTFAVEHILSTWNSNLSAPEIFDVIRNAETDELQDVFEEHDVIVWNAYDSMDLDDQARALQMLASAAEATEALP